MKQNLSEKWIKASIAGTIWAASEIVLGSFLHNLKVPFSGNILTAIGLIILISISYLWTEKGLFWRAGLICAIMKTMSPSAIIFGPMLGIFAESVLLELSVRLLGRTIPGYAAGAMLAMSWNLLQKIGSYLLYYGENIIGVYSNLLKMAQKQLNIQTDIVWLPIFVLLAVYALFGLFAAIIGIRVGRKMRDRPFIETPSSNEQISEVFHNKPAENFGYSVSWLFANLLLIIGSFFLLNYTEWYVWSPAIVVIVTVWALRYKRALRQLSKPRFWLFFIVITLLTAFVFTRTNEGENYFIRGLLTGIQMNFRAVVIIMGFATLGTELYNPVVRNFFLRTHFRNLPLALELSAESLPAFIAAIPDFRSLRKDPVSIFSRVIAHAGMRFSEIKDRNERKIMIITGPRDSGKTTFAKKLARELGRRGQATAGFFSERIMDGSDTKGYFIVSTETGEKELFLTVDDNAGGEKIGKFAIVEKGLETGRKLLHSLEGKRNLIVIIDEAGRLELSGGGWSDNITGLVKAGNDMILVVRDEFAGKIREKFGLTDAIVTDILKSGVEVAADLLWEGR